MSQIQHTAVAVFDDLAQADGAIRELRQKGFAEGQVHLISGVEEGRRQVENPSTAGAAQEAGIGMLVGASVGGLAGLAPGAAVGAIAGGLLGAFIGLGVPSEEARYYQDQLRAGRVLVAVNAPGRYEEAAAVLRGHGGRVDESPLSEVGPGVLP